MPDLNSGEEFKMNKYIVQIEVSNDLMMKYYVSRTDVRMANFQSNANRSQKQESLSQVKGRKIKW